MGCHRCGGPATLHVFEVVAGKKRKVQLCEGCAAAAGLVAAGGGDGLNLPALVGLLMGLPAGSGLACPDCGLTYGAFRADGRLGCPTEYDAFRPALEPLLERIHRATAHAGKRPRRAERGRLRAELAEAVAAERYEDAARLRDTLRADSLTDGGGGADEPG